MVEDNEILDIENSKFGEYFVKMYNAEIASEFW